MKTIARSQVIILPNRQRQEFEPEALQELKVSIEDRALMHPPVFRTPSSTDREKFPEINFNNCLVLVAGERRLKALDEIFELGGNFSCNGQLFTSERGIIPYTDLGSLTLLEAEEAELDENLKRRDLTWQEHAAAVKRLHELRNAQKLETAVRQGSVAAQQTYADTALELLGKSEGSNQDTIRKEILVAKHLGNPAVAKAKSADEAFKILKREEEQKKNIELARVVGATFNADLHKLVNGNCLGVMQSLVDAPEEEKFDVILTDPPYGMGADSFGDGAGRLTGIEHHYDDSFEAWQKLMSGPSGWCALSYKVAKSQAHAYVFCDIDNFGVLKDWMREAGWYVFRTPLIVHKQNSGRVPLPDRGPRRQYETLLYAIKGNKPVTHIYPDVITATADDNMTHGAQKPVAVYQNLLQRSVRPGDRVADFFAGSGTIFAAAHTMKCTAFATEQNPEYYGMCLKRIKSLKELEEPGLF